MYSNLRGLRRNQRPIDGSLKYTKDGLRARRGDCINVDESAGRGRLNSIHHLGIGSVLWEGNLGTGHLPEAATLDLPFQVVSYLSSRIVLLP